ncbi:DUF2332 domain-containing protein [Streptomyces fragilis]|uniref:DUF2332 domain-containing protein n=1 Tax=Streptomyces fragilis TaxID=67301 RepID=A0ABV2YK27_9ACTN|nr:DUF2332 domain-containing protein [Streptomyces fragilis]
MPGSRPAPLGGTRTLTDTYRRFAVSDAAKASPLSARVALALGASARALRVVETAPAHRRSPRLILSVLHDLALAGRAPGLVAAYRTGDAEAAAAAAVDTLLGMADEVVATAARRRAPAEATGRHTVLRPVVAEAAHRLAADAVALIDLDCAAGFNLDVHRVAVTYGNGRTLGDPSSPVRRAASVVGGRRLPERAFPQVVARLGLDAHPVDVTDEAEARWLRAGRWPDRPEEIAALEAEVALAAADPPRLLAGDVLDTLPEAFTRVPAGALPVVTTTWALSRLRRQDRLRFLDLLRDAARGRPVAWVSAEGVGVAPTVPTLGDRPASGHSILGLALFDGPGALTAAVGRCWARGRMLTWLADDAD